MGARIEAGLGERVPRVFEVNNTRLQPNLQRIAGWGVLTAAFTMATSLLAKHKWGILLVGAAAGGAAGGAQYQAYRDAQKQVDFQEAWRAVQIYKAMLANQCVLPSSHEVLPEGELNLLKATAEQADTLYKRIHTDNIYSDDLGMLRVFTSCVKILQTSMNNRLANFKFHFENNAAAVITSLAEKKLQELLTDAFDKRVAEQVNKHLTNLLPAQAAVTVSMGIKQEGADSI